MVRDVFAANQISDSVEHKFALKRIEQLWEVECGTALGKDLDELIDIVCKYEEHILS